MRVILWATSALLMLAMPSVVADDPFREPYCPDGTTCVGPGACTPAACIPPSCQPLFDCYGSVIPADECADNVTIQGSTCQGVVGVGARPAPATDAWVAIAASDGHVDALNAPNSWISPSAQASLVFAGIPLGTLSVGLSRNVIVDEHEWTNVALVVSQGPGVTGGETVSVSVQSLDGAPEGCEARTTRQTFARCEDYDDLPESLP